MKFARDEVIERMKGAGRLRREASALLVASAAYFIVTSMVTPRVYAEAGLDVDRAVEAAAGNAHHHAMMRSSCAGLMDFLGEAGLLTRAARRIYGRAHLL